MQSMGDAIKQLMDRYVKPIGECPQCHEQMVVWKTPNRDGGLKCPPVCPSCGFSEKRVKGATLSDIDATVAAKRNKAREYMRHSSLVSNEQVYSYTFKGFVANTPQQAKALEFAHKLADRIVSNDGKKPVHALLTGQTGRGKTHLAMGIVYNVLARTNYQAKVAFLDWRELVDTVKGGMHEDSRDVQKYADYLIGEFKGADIVVLDDLGAERPTPFNRELADKFWRLREHKTVITTTNLTPVELKEMYGDRMVSRMQTYGTSNNLSMAGIEDYRARLGA